MRIFVTGGAGYIGSVCSELLMDEGHEVTIFDNLIEGHRRALDSRAQFIHGDLADRNWLSKKCFAGTTRYMESSLFHCDISMHRALPRISAKITGLRHI